MTYALTGLIFAAAALLEISGSFAFWTWLRSGGTWMWVVPGLVALAVFAFLLTRLDAAFAGRAFAAYGGVYIAGSLTWLWLVEGKIPDKWDLTGGAICLIGATVIIFGPRGEMG